MDNPRSQVQLGDKIVKMDLRAQIARIVKTLRSAVHIVSE